MRDGFPRMAGVLFRNPSWWLLGLLVAALLVPAFGGDRWREALRYEREAVLAGEYWRLLTAHFVHGTPRHLWLNALGLGVIAALFPRGYTPAAWLLILACSVLAIDAAFVFYEPQLQWYVGFSGVLHGALAAGTIALWKHESKALALGLAVLLCFKLGWEQWHGALPLAGELPVVVDAHLYGAIGGSIGAVLVALASRGVTRQWLQGRRSL